MAFEQAERTRLWLRCALFGPSGSGKTMTALRMAKGIADTMGGRYAVIDTEARSAAKYADRFTFVGENLNEKTVDHYIAAMNEAAKAGCQVLVIDSLSHAWRELTDEVDRIAQNSASKNTFSPWAKVNPKQKRFIDAILNFPGHIIATMRSKTEWVIGEGRNGKTAPEKMGLAPEQGKGIEYEFDLLVELNQRHQGVITKDRTGKFQDETIDKPGEEFGVALYEWLSSGNAVLPPVPPVDTPPETVAAGNTKKATAQPKTTQPAAPTGYKAAGAAVIAEIGEILNAVTAAGQPCFLEDDKAEARQIVAAVKADAEGLKKLREFKAFLAGERAKREPQKATATKAA
jgi:energy-coupling factor transporter ATP-binding protein EcfA2